MKKLITAIIALAFGFSSIVAMPALATSGVSPVPTPVTTFAAGSGGPSRPAAAILTGCASEENGNGEGIKCILRLVVNIMSIGIGVLGVLGITISGIQYITAGGSEEQTRKAKRRIFEIILGLAAYAAAYLILSFLLPEFTGTV